MAFAMRSLSALFGAALLITLSYAPEATAQLLSGSAQTGPGQLWPAQPGPAQSTPAQAIPAQSIPAQSAQMPPAQPAPAQPLPQPTPPPRIVDEVKIGVLVHDIGFLGHHVEGGEDINAEILFTSPGFLRYIWSPRPHIGVDANGSGYTTNYYAGLTWGGVFYRPGWSRGDGFFAYFSEGGSVNDGKIVSTQSNRKSLGSHELFKEGLDIGYQLNDVVSVAGYIDHISNADLADHNAGITNCGLRVGYKF
jgi:lipid A 3-O-deacylase